MTIKARTELQLSEQYSIFIQQFQVEQAQSGRYSIIVTGWKQSSCNRVGPLDLQKTIQMISHKISTQSRLFNQLSNKSASKSILYNPIKPARYQSSFRKIGLHDSLITNLAKNNILIPTEIQSKAIGSLFKKKHQILLSECGTGKTLAYLLPVLSNLISTKSQFENIQYSMRSLIIVPNKELAQQTYDTLQLYSENTGIKSVLLKDSSEIKIPPQTDIVVSTMAIQELIQLQWDKLYAYLQNIVIDEMDLVFGEQELNKKNNSLKMFYEMIQKTKKDDIYKIFVCATLPKGPKSAFELLKKKYKDLDVISTVNSHSLSANLKQEFLEIAGKDEQQQFDNKLDELLNIIREDQEPRKVIIFANKKDRVDQIAKGIELLADSSASLKDRIQVYKIHHKVKQEDRAKIFDEFAFASKQDHLTQILVSGDVVARGVDFKDIDRVVQFDFATNVIQYIHRAGRTARAGSTGEIINFVTENDQQFVNVLKKELQQHDDKSSSKLDKLFSRNRSLRKRIKRGLL